MNRLSRTFCVLVLLGLSAFHGASAQQRLQPVDEAATRPDFFSFRAQLGFVAKRYVRSPIDYRAIFEKSDGRWQMSIFIAGD